MAKFSQAFLQGLLQPTYGQGLFTAAQQAARLPEQLRQQQLEQQKKIAEEQRLAQQQKYKAGLMSMAAAGAMEPEMLRGALGGAAELGIDPSAAAKAIETGKGFQTKPYFTRAEMIDLRDTYTPKSIMEANVNRDFSLLDPYDDADEATVAAGITEWVRPEAPDTVVLRTVQDNQGNTRKLGSPQTLIGEDDLEDLQKKTKPAVEVSLGDKAAQVYGAETAKGLAAFDIELAGQADTLYPERSAIAEAQNIVEANPEIFGFVAEGRQNLRSASLYLINAIGADADDEIREVLADQSADADMIKSFTQDFVRKRMEATKGAITEREFDTFMASVPNLLQTTAGYARLLNYMNSVNERAIMYSEEMRDVLTFSGKDAQRKATELRKTWGQFTSDFPLTTFMPPPEQKKLFKAYISKKGKVNRGKDIKFELRSGGQPVAIIDYNTLSQRAAQAGKPTALYINDLYYGKTGTTIKLDLSGFDF